MNKVNDLPPDIGDDADPAGEDLTRGRVILTYGRSLMSLVAAQSLVRKGVEVIGCDSVGMTVLQFSRFVHDNFIHPDPNDDEDRYIEALCKEIEAHRPDDGRPYVLMPMFRDSRLLARRAADLPDYITLAAPDVTSILKIYPKDNLAETLSGTPVPAPATVVLDADNDAAAKTAGLSYPLVIKPVDGVGGRGVVFCDDIAALEAAFAAAREGADGGFVVQEAAPGEDYCMTAIADRGELKAAMAYRNISVFPRQSGAGSLRETVEHEPFLEATRMLLRLTEWHGVAELDFRWTGDAADTPQLIEINPRFWAGLYHSIASGVDYPWLLYELMTEGAIKENVTTDVGAVTRTPVLSVASAFQEIADSAIDLDRAGHAVRAGLKDAAKGKIMKGLRKAAAGLRNGLDFDDACFQLYSKFGALKEAPSEFTAEDDAYARLGALFILSSLIRRGRLPDEIKF